MNVDKQLELLVRNLDKPDPEIDGIWLKEAEAGLDVFRKGKTDGVAAENVIGETI